MSVWKGTAILRFAVVVRVSGSAKTTQNECPVPAQRLMRSRGREKCYHTLGLTSLSLVLGLTTLGLIKFYPCLWEGELLKHRYAKLNLDFYIISIFISSMKKMYH